MLKDCFVIYTCDAWKSTSSLQLEYIVENINDLFRALRQMVKDEEIEVDPFPNDIDAACDYLLEYQSNRNKLFDGEVDLCDLDGRLKYCSVQRFKIGIE